MLLTGLLLQLGCNRKRKEGVYVVSQSGIIRMGRTEWKGEQ